MTAPNPTLKEYRVPAPMMQALGVLVFEQPASRVLDLAVDLRNLCAQQEASGDPLSLDTMVERFLSWKLPATVLTDGHTHIPHTDRPVGWQGTGTNLMGAVEARAMLAHVTGLTG